MEKDAAITVRLPASLKRRLESRADAGHRSLSAQVLADLEHAIEEDVAPSSGAGSFLGRFARTRVPSEDDIAEARSLLWGRLFRGG